LHSGGGSLSEVVSVSPEWWTPTAKAKAVAGLVLGLRFCHSFGLLHGHLTADNVYFNEDRVIQITDFCVNRLAERDWKSGENMDVGGFCGKDWTPMSDIRAFVDLFSVIVVGASDRQSECCPRVPRFFSEIIERGLFSDTRTGESMVNIFNTLQENGFKILDDVDSDEVSTFVNWVESSEKEAE
jgi:serine/threonine protein kinase